MTKTITVSQASIDALRATRDRTVQAFYEAYERERDEIARRIADMADLIRQGEELHRHPIEYRLEGA
jgi:hypothetical protein